jgi:exosortase
MGSSKIVEAKKLSDTVGAGQAQLQSYALLASACGTLLIVVMLWAYWPTLQDVVAAWSNQPDYSHGFLVAPLAILFMWIRRKDFPHDRLQPSLWGLLVLLGVCVVRVLAALYFIQPIDAWTIPLWVLGATWLLFGAACVRWCLPSIAFLWFMFPIPFSAESWLSVPLQAVATRLSTAGLLILGQPALSEGNTIWLGDHQMMVAEACSGLRIFVGIFALAFAFVLFSRWSWWQKALALIAALPVAIVANVTRIIGTGLLHELVSGEAAHKFSHDLAGIVMIPFAAMIFWGFLVYLDRLFPEVVLVPPMARVYADSER